MVIAIVVLSFLVLGTTYLARHEHARAEAARDRLVAVRKQRDWYREFLIQQAESLNARADRAADACPACFVRRRRGVS